MLFLFDDSDAYDSLLLMVIMNSISGEISSQAGFYSNFNMLLPNFKMLLPILLKDCDNSDVGCKINKEI